MTTTDLLAVSDLLRVCRTFQCFSEEAVAAAEGGVLLRLTDKQRADLLAAYMLMQLALRRFEPEFLEALLNNLESLKKPHLRLV